MLPGWVITTLCVLAWLVPAGIAAAHALMYKRDPRATVLWVFASFALPVLGPFLYWALGINRIERIALKHLGQRGQPLAAHGPADAAAREEAVATAVGPHVTLRSIADRVTRMPLLPGNTITPLHNGEQAYPRMLDAIACAQRTVTLISYIFDWDDVGHSFARALDYAARRGVRVHALLDGIGAQGAFSRMGRLLLRSGATVAVFFPLRFPFGRVRINLRNHRKILVVDGHLGFTGGMNVSQRHLAERPGPGRVQDLHFELTGPVVAELQHAFVEDWALATDEVLSGEDYLPPLVPTGPAVCRGIASGPDQSPAPLPWVIQAAFAGAQDSVLVVTPYFVPPPALISAMVMAALRGVQITLVLPEQLDLPFMRWVADAYLWQLLEHGVRVFRQPPPFVHTKLIVVDRRWVLLGSANLDPRSLRLNFEFNVEAYDAVLAAHLSDWLDQRLAGAHEVTLAEVDARPPHIRLRDGIAKAFSPFL